MKQLKWTTEVYYVDLETGEMLFPHIAKTLYITVKQTKHVTIDENSLWGLITRINECTRSRQTELFPSST